MQELLGRIAALDPEASLGIRIIACFDELILGNVNTRGLLATAAALAGCPAGFADTHTDRPALRVDSAGGASDTAGPPADAPGIETGGLRVWLEREGAPHANDAIILERLQLAVGIRRGRERRDLEPRRDLGLAVDGAVPVEQRREAAVRLGLNPAAPHRVLAAPLFAVWDSHPAGAGDVVATEYGPIHLVVVTAGTAVPDVRPSGVGTAVDVADLPRSFATALTALRLCSPPEEPNVAADDYGGLLDLLATGDRPPTRDVTCLEAVMAHPWARATLDAVLRTTTLREAARLAHVHHSTMQARMETLSGQLGFDPTAGYGRARLGMAYLGWRLQHSRVLDLPTPQGAVPARRR